MSTFAVSPTSVTPPATVTATGSGWGTNDRFQIRDASVRLASFRATAGSFSQVLSVTGGGTHYLNLETWTKGGWAVVGGATVTVLTGSVPSVPQSLVATGLNGSVALTWGQPSSNGGSSITGYKLYRVGRTTLTLGVVLSYNDPGLVNGTSYSYTVSALNMNGESVQTGAQAATPTGPPTVPQGLTPTVSSGQVVLNWTAPASNGGSAITGYKVYGGPSPVTLGVVLTYTATGLTNGQTYLYSVSAFNAKGEGPQTAQISVIPTGLPSAPLNLSAVGGDQQIVLTWAAPSSNGGSAVTGYKVYRTSSLPSPVAVAGTSFTDTGLTNGTPYSYTVSAVNANGEGPQCVAQAATPAAPSIVITGVAVSAITQTGASVSWNVNQFATGQVQYGLSAPGNLYTTREDSFNYSSHVQTISGLTANTLYHFRCISTNAAGQTAYSAGDPTFLTLATVGPPPPTRPFAAPVTTQTVSVPTTVDKTGATDASAALNTWLGTVADGSIINFAAGGIYRMDHGLKFGGNATVVRHNLVFEGNGATLKANGSGGLTGDSPFALWNDNTDIVIHNFNIVGNNPTPGLYQGGALEDQYGILMYGGQRIEIYGCTISNTYADAVIVAVGSQNAGPPSGVWIHNNTIHDIGRMGISPTSSTGLGVLIENNSFTRVNWVCLDIEPNVDSQADNHIIFRNNTIGPQPTVGRHDPSFVSVGGGLVAGTVGDITITGNILTGQSMRVDVPNPGSTFRRYTVSITNNQSDTIAAGPVIRIAHVDGLTVTGNVQPLGSGSLTSVSDCTNVVVT